MKTISGKRLYEGVHYRDLREMLRASRKRYPNNPAYMFRRQPKGEVLMRTYQDLMDDIEGLGTALWQRGLAGSAIAVMAENSYEWAVAYNAVCCGCGVVVPIDKLLPENESVRLLQRSRAKAICVSPKLLPLALAALEQVETLQWVVVFDELKREKEKLTLPEDERVLRYSALIAEGQTALAEGERAYLDAPIDPDAMSILLFTSGTTQQSKGVMLSHRNICANLYGISGSLDIQPGERCLSVLPLSHTFETTAGMYVMLSNGCCICFMDGLRYLANNLVEWKINLMIGVPLLFENIYKRVKDSIEQQGATGLVALMRPVARTAASFGFRINRRLFKSVIDGLGGGLRLVVSGAAALDPEIHQAFIDFGVHFMQGYGLTEASPVISVGTVKNNVPGTVGPPLPGVEVYIDSESDDERMGEILVRAESVMLGYYENEEATQQAKTADGWLRTGDMGYIDPRGNLVITGRSKSMIVLTNGKKVFPEELEAAINEIPGVLESLVWGEKNARDTIDLCTKIQIKRDDLPKHLSQSSHEELTRYIQTEIERINREVPAYKAVRYLLLTEEDFIHTTTLKIKRNEEKKKIEALLEAGQRHMRELSGSWVEDLR